MFEFGDMTCYDFSIEKRRAANTTPQTEKVAGICLFSLRSQTRAQSLLAVFLFVHKFDEFNQTTKYQFLNFSKIGAF